MIKMVEKYSCSTCACNVDNVCRLNPPPGQVRVFDGDGCVLGWRPREGRVPHPDQVSLECWK